MSSVQPEVDRVATLMTQFEAAWPLLEQAIQRHGPTHTKAEVAELLQTGAAQLWAGEGALIVTVDRTYGTGMRTLNGWLAHGEIHAIAALWREIEARAAAAGIHRIQLLGPKGWKRFLPDYSERCVLLTKELRNV